MSLSTALHNAFSGLKANSKAATLVSTNIANATTESYGRRELDLRSGAAGTGGGVVINAVLRQIDPVLIADRRQSDAESAQGGGILAYFNRIELQVGNSESSGSLMERVTAFENALLTAESNPSSAQRLEQVGSSANALAIKLNDLTDQLQSARLSADKEIGSQVTTLNETLVRLDAINDDLVTASVTGGDAASLLDEQARLLDGISEIVPLRVVQNDRGDVSVYTTGGAVLLDGRPSVVGFETTPAIDANRTLADGNLSGLTLNGLPVSTSDSGMLRGGSLAAQFEIRDEIAVSGQSELDAIARDLVERLGPGGPDTTLAATDPGLFTDAGAVFDPLDENGLAGRIALNDLVAPGSGGSWRLRDGLGAAAQGPVGDARLLQGISAALGAANVPASASLAPVAKSFSTHVADFTSSIAGGRVRAESQQTFLTSQNTQLKELELSKGVDTDAELQKLMQIEQLYTANAKMMQTVDEMLERLMSI